MPKDGSHGLIGKVVRLVLPGGGPRSTLAGASDPSEGESESEFEGGEYGWCEETGEPIGIPRLIARPTATLSLEAQQRRELKQKLYGD